MRRALVYMSVGGLLTFLGLCVSAAIDLVREGRVRVPVVGAGCTAECKCNCGQPTCGCHIKRLRLVK